MVDNIFSSTAYEEIRQTFPRVRSHGDHVMTIVLKGNDYGHNDFLLLY